MRTRRAALRFYALILLLVFILSSVCLSLTYSRYKSAVEYTGSLKAQRTQLLDDNSAKRAELSYRGSDQYVIRVARDELNLIMPGEIRYVSSY